jgi:hypothetical protein
MTPVSEIPQCVVANLFWCIHIQLAALLLPLTLSIQTNVPLDRYVHS